MTSAAYNRLAGDYYNSNPISGGNPGGMGDDGHETNFPLALDDIATVAGEAAASAAAAHGSETLAGQHEDAADASAVAAHGSETLAGQHMAAAEGFRDEAEGFRDEARQARDDAVAIVDFDASTRTISAAGLATGGGTLAADRTITVTAATLLEAQTGDGDGVMTAELTREAIAFQAPFAPMMFGTGRHGDVAVTGAVTLTEDMDYRNLTISGAGSINTAGFRIFVSEVLDLTAAGAGAIRNDGGSGGAGGNGTGGGASPAVGAAGAAAPGVTVGASAAGVAGSAGTINAGSGGLAGLAGKNGGVGGASGVSGATGSAAGAAALGGTVAPALVHVLRRNLTDAELSFALTPGGASGASGPGGAGTSSGTQYSGGSGGGSGAAGGVVQVHARTITRGPGTAAGAIRAKGGAGGAGGDGMLNDAALTSTGGGSGGAGGGGGWVYIVCMFLLGSAAATAVDVTGGGGGKGGDRLAGTTTGEGGSSGGTGAGGRFTKWVLSTATYADTLSGAAAKAPVAQVGGAGGAAQAANAATFSL